MGRYPAASIFSSSGAIAAQPAGSAPSAQGKGQPSVVSHLANTALTLSRESGSPHASVAAALCLSLRVCCFMKRSAGSANSCPLHPATLLSSVWHVAQFVPTRR